MNKRILSFSAFLFFLLLALPGKTQFFYYGQEPASVEWKQINTDHFTVHFSRNSSLQAYYYARLMEKTRAFFSEKTGVTPRHTDVVIHNRSVVSNGFSVPAPLRMEINTIAPQSSNAQKWLQQLSLHEYYHTQQIEIFRQGFARHLTWLMGDAATTGAMARLPFWFIEGEAVAGETAYTESGRGRDADFLMKLRAAMNEQGIYSYDKAINGSYKDKQLNYYNLGYHLVAHGTKKYGDSLWQKVSRETARKPYALAPFAASIKRHTGKELEAFYREAMRDVVDNLKIRKKKETEWDTIDTPSGIYKTYTHARRVGGNIIAYRVSYKDIPAFVKLSGTNEEVLHYPGSVFDEKIAIGENAIYWAEYYNDARWGLQSYSVLKKYDYQKEKTVELTSRNKRYFAPDVSPHKEVLTAVRANKSGDYALVVINPENGKTIYSREFPPGEFVMTPRWSAQGDKIVFVKVTGRGKAIYYLDPTTDKVKKIFGETRFDISHPFLSREHLFFIAPYRGKNDLFALRLKTQDLYRLTDAKYGVGYPSFHPSGEILLSSYTSKGYKLRSFDVKEGLWKKTRIPAGEPFRLASKIKRKPIDYEELPEPEKEVKDYKKEKNLFNFHSLTPFGYSKNNQFYGPGISVHSQNLMSSMFTSAGYYYDYDDEGGNYYVDVAYDGWYPRLNLGAEYGRRERVLEVNEREKLIKWNQMKVSGGLELPYRFNAAAFNRFLSVGLTGDYRVNDIYNSDTLRFSNDKFFTLQSRIYFSNLRRQSHRDLYPEFGQVLEMNFLHSWLPSSSNGDIFSAEGWFYFPGFTKNHHLRVYSGYEYNTSPNLLLSGYVNHPRGSSIYHYQDIWSSQLNYSFPLFYPEWNIGKLMYFKRFHTNLFMDMAQVNVQQFDDFVLTTGVEVFAETHFFRLIAPSTLGLRTAWALEDNALTLEFMLRTNFNIY
ncbi:MAG: hypothetical protein K9J27_08785 [Bacteroidales bacterium]|nr:hypothetical protein [Bacteroidales bacterium]MCF8334394.1 hypothetical protein [Bacteroidales bacterium]